jgi:hypothetical protein
MPNEISKAAAELKDYNRPEEQTYLGLPEWYIVFNGDEYANFLKSNKPSDFPYWLSMKEFWKLKKQVNELTDGKYPSNTGANVMLWVIGTSYSVELVLKGIYENSVGRITEWLTNDKGTDEDRLISRFHKEYADFVHIYPWYEFKFFERFLTFWRAAPLLGENNIRKWERKVFFSIEYLVKSAYGTLIALGTKASYEPEASTVYAVLNDPGHKLSNFPDIKVLKNFDSYDLAMVPRYDKFRQLASELGNSGIQFIEISGNRKIFLTLLVNAQNEPQIDAGEVVGKSAVVTNLSKERLLIACSVSSLSELLVSIQNKPVTGEHIFDY